MPAETHMHSGDVERESVVALVRDRLSEILERDLTAAPESARFAEDLGADSLALVELVDMLEEDLSERAVDFRFEDEDLGDLLTIGDTADYILAKWGR